jgi:toxin ParE1/3/4
MKIHKVLISENAINDLSSIAEYIALDSPERAEKFIDDMINSLTNTLSILPLSGKVIFKLKDQDIRSLPYRKYISFYRVNNDVEILHIFNSAQNAQNIISSIKNDLI